MKIGAKVVLILSLVIAAIMLGYAYFSLNIWKGELTDEMRKEVRAMGVILQIAIENSFRDRQLSDTQRLVDRIGDYERVLGVIVYDKKGRRIAVSKSIKDRLLPRPQGLEGVLATGTTAEAFAPVGEEKTYSYILPLRGPQQQIAGAVEIFQQTSFLEKRLSRAQHRVSLVSMVLMLTLSAAVLLLIYLYVSRPIDALVEAVKAVGEGQLKEQIPVRRSDELARLAREFNRMAERLDRAHQQLLQETAEKIELERKLRHSEKLAAIGQLASGLAHEIGTPLNIVSGRTEYLLRKVPQGDDLLGKNLQEILSEIDRITRVVRKLLDFARRKPPTLRDLDLNELLGRVLELLGPQASSQGIEIRLELREDPLMVHADPDQLQQVFLNLCLNALQAMPQGGKLTISSSSTGSRPDPGEAMDPQEIHVAVADTGVGIPPENLGRIFEPFFTTKDSGQGTGLGLALSRDIVLEHGGRIEVESQVGRDSHFHVYLPLKPVEG